MSVATFRSGLTPIVRARATAACLAILSLSLGLGIMIYDGLIASLPQFRLFWLLLGGVIFYLPGVAYGLAWWGLGRGRAWTGRLAMGVAVPQAALSLAFGIGNIATGLAPSVFILAECLLWTTACVILFLQIRRALPWVEADTGDHHGFEVTPLAEIAE